MIATVIISSKLVNGWPLAGLFSRCRHLLKLVDLRLQCRVHSFVDGRDSSRHVTNVTMPSAAMISRRTQAMIRVRVADEDSAPTTGVSLGWRGLLP